MRVFKYLVFIVLLLSIFSCRSTKDVFKVESSIPPISKRKLYKKVKDSTLQYTALRLKKVKISIIDEGKTNSYKGSIRIIKDSSIWISMNAALGIEAARFLLTKDSVFYIDRYHKEYFKGGYEFFSDKLGVEINYKLIQGFLTSEFINYEREIKNVKNPLYNLVNAQVDNGLYYFLSLSDRKLQRRKRKIERFLNRKKSINQYYQIIYVNPNTFKVNNVLVEDIGAHWQMKVKYSDYSRFSGNLFHNNVDFLLTTIKTKIQCSIKYSGIQFKDKLSLPFRIPSNYKSVK